VPEDRDDHAAGSGRAGSAGRMVLVHGFTQTARSWNHMTALFRERLGSDLDVVTLDAPGHGDRGDDHADLVAGARRLADEGGEATWFGYSMGARLCLHVALERPDVVQRLVLLGGTPGIADAGERAARRAADDALADEIERVGVDAFLERWVAQPMFAGVSAEAAGMTDRRRNTATGLAASLRRCGTGAQVPLWDRLDQIRVPTLVLAGERDEKYTAVGRRMAALLPRGTFVAVEGAGHAAHLERPSAVAALVTAWLLELSA
jgi:2-succinyl-6-hydroxy-2,4-cyclohexadiene-1-carboxylate synthase